MSSDQAAIDVATATPAERQQALEWLLAGTPAEWRSQQLAEMLADAAAQPAMFDGLMLARQAGSPVGVVWGQMLPGGGATVWPPRTIGEVTHIEPLFDALLAAVVEYLRMQGAALAQVLLSLADRDLAPHLLRARFEHVADLVYLVALALPMGETSAAGKPALQSESAPPKKSSPATPITFESLASAGMSRFERTFAQTFLHTLDCPRLNGRRSPAEMLDEYQHVGVFNAERWLLVRDGANDVGCLLLSAHPDQLTWELVYMGLVPEVRGRGWGALVVQHARHFAASQGGDKILLAVDRANSPAVKMYESSGFVGWEERAAYVCFFS